MKPPPGELSIPQVMRALHLRRYHQALKLVRTGALGPVTVTAGRPRYTVSEAAVREYVARQLAPLVKA
jgi:hypothetical protein